MRFMSSPFISDSLAHISYAYKLVDPKSPTILDYALIYVFKILLKCS